MDTTITREGVTELRMNLSGCMPAAVLQSIAGRSVGREEAMNTAAREACAVSEHAGMPLEAVEVMDAMISTGDVAIF